MLIRKYAHQINRSVILAICFLTFPGQINFCKSRSYCKNKRKLVDRTVCVCNFLNLLFICTVSVFYWLLMFIKNFLLSLNLYLVYLTLISTTMLNWTCQDTFDHVMTTILVTDYCCTALYQGHPTSVFGENICSEDDWIYNFRNICCKISCLPDSPRIFEHLKNGIIAHF